MGLVNGWRVPIVVFIAFLVCVATLERRTAEPDLGWNVNVHLEND